MKLWLLRPVNDLPEGDNPWEPWYDKAFGFVVRAETEEDARKVADENSGDEKRGEFLREKIANTTAPWIDAKYSTCIELTADGPQEMIIQDVWAA